jgi:hypothetical protein
MAKSKTANTKTTAPETKKEEVVATTVAEPAAEVAVEAAETASALSVLDTFVKNMQENVKYQQVLLKNLTAVRRELKTLQERVEKLEAKAAKSVKAPRRGGNGQPLRKKVPVYSAAFSDFINKNHSSLKNKDGSMIVTALEKDGEGHIVVSREDCLKMVNAYIRQHNLNKFDDKKLISLDATLQKIISPKGKDGKAITYKDAAGKDMKNVCAYKDIMGSIAPHLKAPVKA